MSHIVALDKINQFLPHEKLPVTDHATVQPLEQTAQDIVFSKLSAIYPTNEWVSPSTTPSMVTNIMSLLIAGWVYDRQFSEEAAEGNSYGSRRVDEAYSLLDGLLTGLYDIGVEAEESGTPVVHETEPIFEMGEPF